eukprot:10021938-Prorocentrum_lima.AAC.1
MYKLLARMMQVRLAAVLEPYLQPTQYGFRAQRGTADALHFVRRVVDEGERTGSRTLLVLLDWEKAFDRISHHRMLEAVE